VTAPPRHVYLQTPGIICSLGSGCAEVYRAMIAGDQSGMLRTDAFSPRAPCFVGRVGIELAHLQTPWIRFDSRNNRLLLAALSQIEASVRDAIGRFGRDRIGVVIGTSTSGILESENAVADWVSTGAMPTSYDYQRQRLSSGSDFLSNYLDIGGPSVSISTACSSSAHAFAHARRLLINDFCDVVIAGGADSLSRLTVRGFQSLESISRCISNPLSINRDGINIGEGACLMLMSKEPSAIGLLGAGASSDAHHISAPDPEGRGARDAMQHALADAAIGAGAVDYINLHGTGTPLNDSMECRAVTELFGASVPCSSTKPLTGHTLGAAGAIELGLCWLILSDANTTCGLPPHCWDGQIDPALPRLTIVGKGHRATTRPKVCLSNSFAFGGNNASLLIGRFD
jgi:3-oxoacyl-[acyl-carrier-protein] synthase-1